MQSSNRTFMELKHVIELHTFCDIRVLIAPLWNWNVISYFFLKKSCRVLIAPLWNWNGSEKARDNLSSRSNRTFMELKRGVIGICGVTFLSSNRTFMELKLALWLCVDCRDIVLIAPLWNWNCFQEFYLLFLSHCSNRTFMELKHREITRNNRINNSSNRTFMELKPFRV